MSIRHALVPPAGLPVLLLAPTRLHHRASVDDLNHTKADGRTFTIRRFATNVIIGSMLVLAASPTAASNIDAHQHGLTGTWYQPSTGGQGIEIEVFPNLVGPGIGFLAGGWFTFDHTAAGGAASQRWYTFGGNVVSGQASATLALYQNVGGNFNALPITSAMPVGTVTLSFADCTTATMMYTFTDGSGRSGTIPLVRLTPNVTCATDGDGASSTNADFGYSGNWYDPVTSGQGIVLELNPKAPVVFFAWYTYAPNGQAQGAGGQRWYTGQASYTPGARSLPMMLYETTGGLFNSATPPAHTVPVGTATATFTSCNATRLAFSFTGGSSAGASGTINLSRVGPVPADCASSSPDGLWLGAADDGTRISAIILDTGVFYFFYYLRGTNSLGGVVQGTFTSSGDSFYSADARDFFIGLGVFDTPTTTTYYAPRETISGFIAGDLRLGFAANYALQYEQPANLAAMAGTYSGSVASLIGWQVAVVTLDSTGSFSGSASGCTFGGTAAPHGSVNALDLTVTFNGGACIFGTGTLTGLAYYDAASRRLFAAAPNATRTDSFLFDGSKP